MPAEILRAGVDDEVHAGIKRAEVERRRPGIVHQHDGAFGVRRAGDGRDVLHFETERSRRLDENRARVFPHQSGDRCAKQGVVIGHSDVEPREDAVAKHPRRSVHAVADQDVVAGLDHRQQRRRDRRQAGRQQRYAGARRTFQFLQGYFECFGRRCAAAAVLIPRSMSDEILGAWVEHGGGVINRRVDEAVVGERIAAGIDHARILLRVRVIPVFLAITSAHTVRSPPVASSVAVQGSASFSPAPYHADF
jgi:hypothetical protein